MRKEIRSIDPLSASKIGCLLTALLGAIFGCLFLFLPLALLPGLLASAAPGQSDALSILGGGVLGGAVVYLLAIIIEAAIAAIVWLIWAVFYNIVAKVVGGIEIEVDR